MPWPSVRCPGALKHFRPASPDGGSSESADERLRSSYGNSILYTDHVLAAVIDILQKSDSVTALLYESDHGEDLPTPTCRLIGHGNGTPYDYRVPAFLWYSDAYAKPPPQRIAAFRKNADKRVLSADTFESLIDMAGVDFPGHDPSWGLFSTEWKYRPGVIDWMWKTDMDHAVYGKQCKIAMPAKG